MPLISITLPSLYPEALERALTNIECATRAPYQVIVVSPFEVHRAVRGGELVWIKETRSTGCNAAHMAAFAQATGEFVTGWVDDHFYSDGWDVMARRDFEEREAAFHAKSPGQVFELGGQTYHVCGRVSAGVVDRNRGACVDPIHLELHRAREDRAGRAYSGV